MHNKINNKTEQGFAQKADFFQNDQKVKTEDLSNINAKVSVFTSETSSLNKTISFKDGKLKKEANGKLWKGKVQVKEIDGLSDLKQLIESIETNQALAIGLPYKDHVPLDLAPVLSKSAAEQDEDGHAIQRTKDYFHFPKGQAGLIYFDIDDYVGSVNEIWDALCEIDPQLMGAEHLIAHSSSSFLSNSKTGEEITGQGGVHIYCMIENAADIPRYGKAFAKRAWLAGYGRIELSAVGSCLVRQIIDDAVFSPERLIFEAQADLDDSVIQTKPPLRLVNGVSLDTSKLIDLTSAENTEYEKLVQKAKDKKKPEQTKLQDKYIEKEAEKLVDSGLGFEEARKTMKASLERSVLYGSQILKFDEFGLIIVSDLLETPKKYDQAGMADPMEPDYNGGIDIAKFYWNDGNPMIHSHAHGGKNYSLKDIPFAGHENDVYELNEQLEIDSFPHVRSSGDSVKATSENLEHLMESYGIEASYDVISKKKGLTFPEGYQECADLEANAKLESLKSLCALNNAPSTLVDRLAPIFSKNETNPVIEFIEKIEWDGVDRISQLIDSIEVKSHSKELLPIVIRKWFIQCVAAADGAVQTPNKLAKPKYENVLVLVGGQGVKKTNFYNALIPSELKQYFMDGAHLDPKDKDSVTYCIKKWVVELGEIDVTFRKADIAALKAFLSRREDTLRLPYDASPSEYQRRTSFGASVNDEQFLADTTGNRRYWPIAVTGFKEVDIDMSQLWAQVWVLYLSGEQWWPDAEMDALLLKVHSEHMQNNPLEDALADRFDLSKRNQGQFYSYNQIFELIDFPKNQSNTKIIGDCLESLGFIRKKTNKARGFFLTAVSESAGDRGVSVKKNVFPILPKDVGGQAMVAR